jgi:hypothetical protein
MESTLRSGLLVALAALALGATQTTDVRGQADSPSLEVESVEAAEKSLAEVSVFASDAGAIGALDLLIEYHPDVVSLEGAREGEVAGNALFDFNEIEPGSVRLGVVASNGLSGDGSVATLSFAVIGAQGESTAISIADVAAWHFEDLIDLPVETNDGGLSVTGASTLSTTTLIILGLVVVVVVLLVALLRSRRSDSQP